MPPILSVRNVTKRFGGLQALEDVSLDVEQGAIWAVIGPNGAGKTTLFNIISGFDRPTSGTVESLGEQIDHWPAHRVVHLGIARTFQNIRLFNRMSVLDNVMAGEHTRLRSTVLGVAIGTRRVRQEEREARERAMSLLEDVGLAGEASALAESLSYGAQRRLEIVRALASNPRLLLLDEPAAGSNLREAQQLSVLISTIRASGVTVVLIEHDMRLVMGTVDGITVLDHGRKIEEGSVEKVQRSPAVIEAYLGVEDHVATGPARTPGDSVDLAIDGLHVSYGNIAAVKGVSLTVREGELVAILGANGAGKTTILKAIMGVLPATAGSMTILGISRRLSPQDVVRLGLSIVPEGRLVFARMSVQENLMMGAFEGSSQAVQEGIERAYGLFPILRQRAGQTAGTLSGGEQQMLAIGRALAGDPRLLMLDEPSMGLAPVLVRQVFDVVRSIHGQGRSVLLVEQNAAAALAIANRGYVIQSGEVALEGDAAALAQDSRVRDAYLGGEQPS